MHEDRGARSRLSVCALLLLSLAAAPGPAQQVRFDAAAERIFTEAMQAYRGGSYKTADQILDSLLRHYPDCHRITAALIMRGKALYALEENYEASKVVRSLLAAYPGTRYRADAELLLARVYERIGRHDDAREAALRAWDALGRDAPARLAEEVRLVLDAILVSHTGLPAVYVLARTSASRSQRGHLWVVAAGRELLAGNAPAAAAAVDTITSAYTDVVPRTTVEQLKERLAGAAVLKLGVLLPLMRGSPPSARREVGNDVCDGILVAHDLFEAAVPRVHVVLEVRDTERDPGTAAAEAKALVSDGAVAGIVGPVFSATTTAAARVAAGAGVPLVTPTANQNGIAATGLAIFQANPDYEQRGRAMARYAVQRLGLRVLAVLSPSDTYAKFLADGFTLEAQELGADVATAEWYPKGTSDLRAQLLAIRRAAVRQGAEPLVSFAGRMARLDVMKLVALGVRPARIDSLLAVSAVVPVRWLLGPRGKERLDSAGIRVSYEEGRIDSLRFPAVGVEALYCPISSPDEIGIVSSQIAYYNIKTQLLGSGEWNSLSQLEANRRYCLGLRFESDSEVDTSAAEYKEFLAAFTARFRRQPGRNTLFGYDAASLVLSLISRGALTRAALAHALTEVRDYRGVRGRIGFTSGRVNSWMHILQYTEDGMVPLGEISGGEER
jgi:ABC-type branched-subunit amino acid transport system substrate-binding protein